MSVIGIIGGMGPHAGVHLAGQIVAHTDAARDADHFSMMLDSRADTIPDRTTFLKNPLAPSPSEAILMSGRRLISAGATVLGMPCNTAHAPIIIGPVLEGIGNAAPFVHLIRETVAFCATVAPEAERVGVLATMGTFRTGIYSDALRDGGLTPVIPDEDIQENLIQRALYDADFGIKSLSNPVREEAVELLALAAEQLRAGGAQAIILGCTELPLAIPGRVFGGLPVVNSTTALARALIRAIDPQKLRPL